MEPPLGPSLRSVALRTFWYVSVAVPNAAGSAVPEEAPEPTAAKGGRCHDTLRSLEAPLWRCHDTLRDPEAFSATCM